MRTKDCPHCWQTLGILVNVCTICGYDYQSQKAPPSQDKVLRPAFPYFGSKRKVVRKVWARFGKVKTFIEPFCGSAAMALAAPCNMNVILNDVNGFVCNFFRALKAASVDVAKWADWPISEFDLHARHRWLTKQTDDIRERLVSDPDWYDAKIAGWWAWGQSVWIAGGWCDGGSKKQKPTLTNPCGVNLNARPALTKVPGVNGNLPRNQRPDLTCTKGVNGKIPYVQHNLGVNGKRPDITHNHGSVITHGEHLRDWFAQLGEKLRDARTCCGDWSRVVTPCCWHDRGDTAVFLDPPYSSHHRDPNLYGSHDSLVVAHLVRKWAIENGDNPRLRIAVCGFEDEHTFPESWKKHEWEGSKGYSKGQNRKRERIWFSPHCER